MEHLDETEEEVREEDKFPDLGHLPPEVALQVLKNLNATDLCLASCVWQQLASDNILWQGLCRSGIDTVDIISKVIASIGHNGSMYQFTTATILHH